MSGDACENTVDRITEGGDAAASLLSPPSLPRLSDLKLRMSLRRAAPPQFNRFLASAGYCCGGMTDCAASVLQAASKALRGDHSFWAPAEHTAAVLYSRQS